MGFRLPDPLVDFPGGAYIIVIFVAVLLLIPRSQGSNLHAIPTVGSSGWLEFLWAGSKFPNNVVDVLQEGYKKHKYSPFKFADVYRWIVILSNREHVDELLRASENDLSSSESVKDRFHTLHMMPQEIHQNRYHVAVIRSQLTRSIGSMCPVIRDEIVTAFDEVLDLKANGEQDLAVVAAIDLRNEWKSIPALSVVRTIVCRTSNRSFVGLPLCRDPDWIDLNIQFTIDFVKTGEKIGLFPRVMRPLVASFLTAIKRDIARGVKLLRPIIEERLNCLREDGIVGVEMPNDLLSWLIEEAKGTPLTVESLAVRMLNVNFASIHTTSNSFTHALLHLAANPQYIQPLREEVEMIIKKDGWTKAALARMHKVDSFLKESQRVTGGILSLTRVAMRDYTFADGTFIPRGTTVGVGTRTIHHDDRVYENPQAFEPFRFAEMSEDKEGAKYRFVSTALDYLSFGHGKHACPGRFFAANELKSLLAHTVTTYDIKLDGDRTGPRSLYTMAGVTPNPRACVLFRRRVD